MIQSSPAAIHLSRFVSDVFVSSSDAQADLGHDLANKTCKECFSTGNTCLQVEESNHSVASLSLPVFAGDTITSVVTLVVTDPEAAGVLEIWGIVGEYEELGLDCGYFGKLERFQNVSSFVRFEKGAGLPGQAWSQELTIIHDHLAKHPGFLRAAGASADALSTAIGIPVFRGADFLATSVLISSTDAPIAKAVEVWKHTDRGFELQSRAIAGSDAPFVLGNEVLVGNDCGILGSCLAAKSAVLTEDPSQLELGSAQEALKLDDVVGGLAIPMFVGDDLRCVTCFFL